VKGIRIGELLVEQGTLTPGEIDQIVQVQRETHRPFGELAEQLFGIDPKAVEDAWVQQYIRISGVIDLESQKIDTDCLRRLNQRQAWQFHVLPMHRQDRELHAATSAEHLVRALNFASRTIDEPIYLLIAQRQQLCDFLMKYYPVPEHIAQYANQLA